MSGHYFEDDPGGEDRRQHVVMTAWGRELTMTTASGVFAREGLDKATEVLLRHDDPPSGTVLDLGCGWGAIACAVAAAGATVWAVDVNERALELTRLNAERHGLDVTACRPDDVPDNVRFDAIWSNPPIRVGKEALHELLLQWLPRLADDGEARLVVGKNLGADSLQRWLTGQGWPTERVASGQGFRILVTRRP